MTQSQHVAHLFRQQRVSVGNGNLQGWNEGVAKLVTAGTTAWRMPREPASMQNKAKWTNGQDL